MPFERLSGDFNRGYTKAIQDIIKIFDYIQPDLAHHHKKLIPKLSMKLLNVILQERDKLREDWEMTVSFVTMDRKKTSSISVLL